MRPPSGLSAVPFTLSRLSGEVVPMPTLTWAGQLFNPAKQPSTSVLLSVTSALEPMAVALLIDPVPNPALDGCFVSGNTTGKST